MRAMAKERKGYAQKLVEERTGRPLADLLRDLYVDRRHSQEEIAQATGVSRTQISEWLRELGISRDDRPAVAL